VYDIDYSCGTSEACDAYTEAARFPAIGVECLRRQLAAATERAEKAERERDEAQSRTERAVVAGEGLLAQLHEAEAENARLREIVEKLPKTADGVPVSEIGKTLYWLNGCLDLREFPVQIVFDCNANILPTSSFGCWVPFSKCYSTREAAEAAKEKAK
jgi:hypothetical protein